MGASIDPVRLVQLIVWYAANQSTKLSEIRLVKLLYLADLYFARGTQGETLTRWPWRFHHYGPWCLESLKSIETAVSAGLIQTETFESRFRDEPAKVYVLDHGARDDFDTDEAERPLPQRVISGLKFAIKRWGDDTYALLDHIYFDTEPMAAAYPEDQLDFTLARPAPRASAPPARPVDREKLARGRELLSRVAAKALQESSYQPPRAVLDGAYMEALRRMDSGAGDVQDSEGTASIAPEGRLVASAK